MFQSSFQLCLKEILFQIILVKSLFVSQGLRIMHEIFQINDKIWIEYVLLEQNCLV